MRIHFDERMIEKKKSKAFSLLPFKLESYSNSYQIVQLRLALSRISSGLSNKTKIVSVTHDYGNWHLFAKLCTSVNKCAQCFLNRRRNMYCKIHFFGYTSDDYWNGIWFFLISFLASFREIVQKVSVLVVDMVVNVYHERRHSICLVFSNQIIKREYVLH